MTKYVQNLDGDDDMEVLSSRAVENKVFWYEMMVNKILLRTS